MTWASDTLSGYSWNAVRKRCRTTMYQHIRCPACSITKKNLSNYCLCLRRSGTLPGTIEAPLRYLGSHHSMHCFPCALCLRRRPAECYPDDTRVAKALETLAASHHEASFLVPVGAVRAVDCLRALSKGGKALVIAGDKGSVSLSFVHFCTFCVCVCAGVLQSLFIPARRKMLFWRCFLQPCVSRSLPST